MSVFEAILVGVETAFIPANLLYCFIGVTVGMITGVLPGIGALAAISLLLPTTYYLDPTAAIIMLGGVYYGAAYGGATASILLNLPGTPSNAVTCLDGFPMAQNGRAGVALLSASTASFVGGNIGILIMMLFSPLIASLALQFSSPEYFSMMLFGLVAASTISVGNPVKSIAMVVLGVLLGAVGTDLNSGVSRFTLGIPDLYEGIGLVPISMGLFGIADVIHSIGVNRDSDGRHVDVSFRSMIPSRDDLRRFWGPALRGAGIGSFMGALPGAGGAIASFIAYAVEKRISSEPERFGRGTVEGVAAPEASNNACDQTAFIPTLTLGIPGSVVMALMLGALMIHGISPGPNLLTDQPRLFWGLVVSFWLGNLMLLILNVPLIGLWVRLLTIPYRYLYPTIVMFICMGVFSLHSSVFEVLLVVFFGVLGYFFKAFGYQPAPLVLGFVLGPLIEENLRRSLLLSRGDFIVFLERPVSAGFVVLTGLLIVSAAWPAIRRNRVRRS